MRVVLQRVASAKIEVQNREISAIGQGLLVFVCVEKGDLFEEVQWLVNKIVGLRIFSDSEGKMNLSVKDVSGEMLIVSQFTLSASTKKGFRPSFIGAARPEEAIPLYEKFIELVREYCPNKVQTGEFGADMQISLVNDGPVTICMDTRNRE